MKYLTSVAFVLSGLIACSTSTAPTKVISSEAAVSSPSALVMEDGAVDAGVALQSPLETKSESHCPSDMVEVRGNYCPEVEQTCLEMDESVVNANGRVRCMKFAPTKCLSKKRKFMNFCIDRMEFPNIKGETPIVMVSWFDMKRSCEAVGKRLCKDVEWEFSCEGEEALPYPTGLNRPVDICNIDHTWRAFNGGKLMNPKTRQEEVDRLSQRVPSGSMPECKSPFGVLDLIGNVDEFTVNSSGVPYQSSLKGGHWSLGARARCRPSTLIHNEYFAFYAEGGRCCKNIR